MAPGLWALMLGLTFPDTWGSRAHVGFAPWADWHATYALDPVIY